jgi:hypothetical protein
MRYENAVKHELGPLETDEPLRAVTLGGSLFEESVAVESPEGLPCNVHEYS